MERKRQMSKFQSTINAYTFHIQTGLAELKHIKYKSKAIDRAIGFLSMNEEKWTKYPLDYDDALHGMNKYRLELKQRRETKIQQLKYYRGVRNKFRRLEGMEQCPECKGKGQVPLAILASPDLDIKKSVLMTEPCKTCKGSGVVPKKKVKDRKII